MFLMRKAEIGIKTRQVFVGRDKANESQKSVPDVGLSEQQFSGAVR